MNTNVNNKKPGRPNMNRMESRLSIRASRTELDAWKATGKEEGFDSLASYLRSLMNSRQYVNNEKNKFLDELKEAVNQVARCGNNLNQIAHHLNGNNHLQSEQTFDAVAECRDLIRTAKRIIRDIKK